MMLSTHIEAVLFYKAVPVKKSALVRLFSVSEEECEEAIAALRERLKAGATRIVESGDTLQLVTAPECSDLIASLRRDELKKDIGKAGAETLAIILYRGPIARTEIDRIRGVNSNFILRNLMTRGLVERTTHPEDPRSYRYVVTTELMKHLGIERKHDLPGYEEMMNALDSYEKEHHEAASENATNLNHTP